MDDLLEHRAVTADELLAALASAPQLLVGDERTVQFLAEFAARLLKPTITRLHPELGSLGFFLRRAELRRLVDAATNSTDGAVKTPRGFVFHVPPANVDTVFVYSWALSLLCGNANVVRISERSAGAARMVIDLLGELLPAQDPALHRSQRFVSFSHNDPAFAELSLACQLRVIWGGDNAVQSVRRHPLSTRATELTFPDRSSLALLAADEILGLSPADLSKLAADFTNDVWWFDQAACSSPTSIVWLGTPDHVAPARTTFFDAVERHLRERGMGQDPSMSVQRRVALYGTAMQYPGTHLDVSRATITTISIESALPRRWFGSGGFAERTVSSVDEIRSLLIGKDQTLSHFGIPRTDLLSMVRNLGGRAIDRVVPVGQALQFHRYWDGHDLLAAMTKSVTVKGGLPG